MPQTALDLLRLLAEDASADRISEQAQQHPEARELALRIRAGIDEHRRREAELSALVETARDLASVADPRGVLDAIVRRARSLLGTDVAYLTLFDPDLGDTFMRATAGSVSARFQTLRLPLGAGLGGLVAQTRRPYWTADYPADERYDHTPEIDGAVGEEGLVAICGTPLLVDGDFVGVLFASHRARRVFRRDEVALLGSLAALAAVSLVQARRVAETADALAALSAAHAGIEQAATAHDRFSQVVLSGGGVDDIAATLGELLACRVAVFDVDDHCLATYGDGPVPRPVAAEGSGRLTRAGDGWAVAVSAAGQRLGTLVLGGVDELDRGQVRTVERAAMVTALVLLFRLRAAESDQRVRTDLLTELLARDGGEPDPALVERGRLLGLQLGVPHVVAVCRGPVRGLAVVAGDGGGLAGPHGDDLVAVVPGTDPSAVAAALARRLGDGPTIGTAGPVVPGGGLREVHERARRTAGALVALGRRAGSAREIGFAGLVGEPADVGDYVHDMLGPVVDYDARRGSDLLGTLEAYFAAGASPRRAAGELHVHVNTVTQRLERVAVLLGADWSGPARALEIQLALHLRRLRTP
ncbi:GAF domain-containing protein [Pseudonocardia petroleophila]|uniref:Helix-turn-helix domain-containing protein n=1 Tax=Pseudonocardia petroleophila TaxID=37331 RepID=A0A7G7MQU1_9PSEU|nr:GAF domain-containing protein [Pseudonocardia petroleophila]QNG55152.1 helix-turn-helix domain-containing protein [Pseudonocardia petroleophila]